MVFFDFSRALLDPQPVRDERDELAIGRLVVQAAHVLAERLIQRLDAPAVPGDLDGVADGALDLARRRVEPLGDARIQLLRDAAHQVGRSAIASEI